ncbi:MAG TPA: MFS transporter [Candidatus Nanopelagicaceae bacterium]
MSRSENRLEIGPVAFLIAGLMFMEFLDASILPTAAPTIARDFHVFSAQIGICVTTYMVALVVLIPVSAWLAEKYGVRKILFAGIIIFVIGSMLCALSTNVDELIVMRIVQGVGAATMVPVGRLILMRSVVRTEVIRVIAYSVWPALVAPVVAPILGGFIIGHTSWHWIFLVNLPIGVVALVIGFKIVPHIPGGNTEKLDWRGFYGSALSLGFLVFGAAALGAPHINTVITIVLFTLSFGIGWPTIRFMRLRSEPLVDLSPLKIQTFQLNSISGFLYRIAQNTAPFALPLLFQDKFGWSAERSGEVLFFYMFGNLGFKVFTTPLMKKFRFKTLILICTVVSIPMSIMMGVMNSSLPLMWMGLLLIISGSIRSLGMTLYNTITFADIDQEIMSHANTLSNMFQQLSSVFAVAFAVIAINVGRAILGTSGQFTIVFSLAAVMLLLSLRRVIELPKDAGDSLRS